MGEKFTVVKRNSRFILYAMLYVSIFVGWALSSPVGGSPDDDYHLASIYCLANEDSKCLETTNPKQVLIQQDIFQSNCFFKEENSNASCQNNVNEGNYIYFLTDRFNNSGLYPDGLYKFQSLFVSDNLTISVLLLRLINSIIFLSLVALVWQFSDNKVRITLNHLLVFSLVPVGLFLIPSTNPSSWAITGVLISLFATLGLLRSTSKKNSIILSISLIFSILITIFSRFDSQLFSALSILLALYLSRKEIKPSQIKTKLVLIFSLGLLLIASFVLGRRTAEFVSSGFSNLEDPLREIAEARSRVDVLFTNLFDLPTFLYSFFGGFEIGSLGWQDVEIPLLAWSLPVFFASSFIFISLGLSSRAELYALIFVLGILFFIPIYILQLSNLFVGEQLQGRYLYPVFLVLMALVFWSISGKINYSRAQLIFIVLALTLSAALSQHALLFRFTHPTSKITNWNLDKNFGFDNWWWEGFFISPMQLFLATSISTLIALVFLVKRILKNRPIELLN